ncbi:MAG: DUF1345 domain-containing protein [Devosia sp.]|uniref:DUF1345 domain-containing protein n=1 Tax=Devosia sp. TaxID=1871048 RepID=UPI0024CDE71D|nr:DUF1345 domain-containing protein [Devosia sp.]UYO00540.1 MAG: DUF1345 domain-containing protein [Devosia sp.]
MTQRIMPRLAPFYGGLVVGVIVAVIALLVVPEFAIGLGASGLFVAFLALTGIKMPLLTADYLRDHAGEEDTPVAGIFLIVFIVILASVVSLFLALGGGNPDPWEVAVGVGAVVLGWFTVHAMGALHYAYEYYETSDGPDIDGGLGFAGRDEPDGYDFLYFSFTVGTSVATSDTKVESRKMRRLVTGHLVFSHLFNTIILASAVNVILSLGGA